MICGKCGWTNQSKSNSIQGLTQERVSALSSACPYCKEAIQPGATVCPHCKQAIFSTNPSTNALLTLITFGATFWLLWTGINWFAKVQTEQKLHDAQQEVERMMKQQ
jgi:hypothetical protein